MKIPKVTALNIQSLVGEEYGRVTAFILSELIPELGDKAGECIRAAYSRFDDDPAPLLKIDDNLCMLELWHGPTCESEDLSATVMPCLPESVRANDLCALAPRVACYFSAYCDLLGDGCIGYGDKADFVVSGRNTADVLAGYYAYEMGLPIGRIICSVGSDGELPEELKRLGKVFYADCAGYEEVEETIADYFDEYGYVIDPHTAAAAAVESRLQSSERERPAVIICTESPHKYASDVLRAIGESVSRDALKNIVHLEEVTAMEAPEQIIKLLRG